jgi:Xaa-Pro aminopeptidase
MKGMRQAHIVDGAAMAHFMAWLEDQVMIQKRSVSEVEIDTVLTGYRAQQPGFVELSFPTIAGVGSNGAIIHYRAKEDSHLLQYLDTERSPKILLDSGGQYEYGTTDVTRTWYLGQGPPDSEYMDHYTRVLKGNIGVDSMIFPENTPGFVLDVFARKALWEVGRDYGHGTGHGVGAALNVHEGPHSISPRWTNKEALRKGMVVSNEPGYYEDGKFGIRIENLLEITYVQEEDNIVYDKGLRPGDEGYPKKPPTQKTFLKFKKLTMIPIQKNLIKIDLMTKQELDWLDEYHQEVFEKVSPLLEEGSPAMNWLKKSCSKMDRGHSS